MEAFARPASCLAGCSVPGRSPYFVPSSDASRTRLQLRISATRKARRIGSCIVASSKDPRPGKGGFFSSNNDNTPMWDPLYACGGGEVLRGCPVPLEQQPINEYRSLSGSDFFSWVTLEPTQLARRVGAIGLGTFVVLGWPVASLSFDPAEEALFCWLAAMAGSFMAMTASLLRLYLGWAYVGNRLFSATVEYEESGWYDGQVWVKPPEVLARDRLLGSYDVKPALVRLKTTLVGLGLALGLSLGALCMLMDTDEDTTPALMESGPIYAAPYKLESALRFEPPGTMDELIVGSIEGVAETLGGLPEYCF